MQKLDMLTPDIIQANIEALSKLFPNIITETENADGTITKAIDYDLFRQMFASTLVEWGEERYRLDWPGKRASILKANTPISKTLRPVVGDSVKWDTTENLYIEWDNFEVLKVLQESYLGKVKMIYIDPPYNTGKDFVYTDNFKVSKDEYEDWLEIVDEEWGRLVRNTDTNGRFHSDWLSMMYERILLARDFLSEDWLVFVSISDKEINNLKSILIEIFWEENFIATLIWNRNHSAQAGIFKVYHEYVLVFAKNSAYITTPKSLENDLFEAGAMKKASGRHSLQDFTFPKGTRFEAPDGTELINEWWDTEKVILVKWRMVSKAWFLLEDVTLRWAFTQVDQMREYFYWNKESLVDSRWQKVEEFYFSSTGKIKVVKKRWVEAPQTTMNYGSQWPISIALAELFNLSESPFDSPKPVSMIEDFILRFTEDGDIVMDFFAGSSTTAQSVFNANAKRPEKISFILVQFPEDLKENLKSATKDGVRTLEVAIDFLQNISKPCLLTELWKERIRRAGKKIVEENKDKEGIENLDIGFRVYRLDTSNMKDVYYHPTEVTQDTLFDMESNIKDDRTPEDILAQVMLNLGLTLDLPIEKRVIHSSTVYYVAENSLVACFDEHVDFSLVDEIASVRPLRVVFRDSSFSTDADRINFETRFAKLSPETDIRVI